MAGFGLEEGEDGFCDCGADVAGDGVLGEELVLLFRGGAGVFDEFREDGGGGDVGEVLVEAGEFLGGRFADVADAHGEEPFVEGLRAGGIEGGDDFGGVLFAEAAGGFLGAEVEVREGFLGEGEEVEGAGGVAVADEGFGDGFAHGIDIEGFAGGKVGDGGDGLGGALEVGAAPCDEAFLLGDGGLAGGAFPIDGIVERVGFLCPDRGR